MQFDSGRIQNPTSIDEAAIRLELSKSGRLTIQFSNASACIDDILEAVDRLCEAYDERLCVRFYAHYGSAFDMQMLLRVPHVKNLCLNCLEKVENLEALSRLDHLRILNLDVDVLDNRTILTTENLTRLQKLVLGWSGAQALDLAPLRHMTDLRSLYVGGHTKNIDVLGSLHKVDRLNLNIGKKTRLEFLNRMVGLKRLKLILGGREDISEVGGSGIEALEIVRVLGFCRFDHLPSWRNLKKLTVDDQIRVQVLPFAETMESLEDLRLLNCKSLTTLHGLRDLPRLHNLHICGTAINFDALTADNLPKALKRFTFYTGRIKPDKLIEKALAQMPFEKGLPAVLECDPLAI